MGGGNSSPEYLDEVKIISNDKAKEKFENKNNNNYFFILIGISLILIILFILFFYKNRYKD